MEVQNLLRNNLTAPFLKEQQNLNLQQSQFRGNRDTRMGPGIGHMSPKAENNRTGREIGLSKHGNWYTGQFRVQLKHTTSNWGKANLEGRTTGLRTPAGPSHMQLSQYLPSGCFKEWGQDCFCFLWFWGWTQSLLLSEHPTTKLNFSPLTTFFFFETGSCEVAQVTLNLLYSQSKSWTSNPSSCLASWAARITGLCPQAWLNFLFFLKSYFTRKLKTRIFTYEITKWGQGAQWGKGHAYLIWLLGNAGWGVQVKAGHSREVD